MPGFGLALTNFATFNHLNFKRYLKTLLLVHSDKCAKFTRSRQLNQIPILNLIAFLTKSKKNGLKGYLSQNNKQTKMATKTEILT